MTERVTTPSMPESDPAPINIQENNKNYEIQRTLVRNWLKADTLYGQVLRVLIHRLKYPERSYSSFELQVLLLISLAELDAEGRP